MGNYVSCIYVAPKTKRLKVARVIMPGGEVRQFSEPVKAAELMLESPSCFLVNSKSLNIGRRFSPLVADDDLELGDLYIMFPMKRVNSVATAADIAFFFMAANSVAKRISGGKGRISPEGTPAAEIPTESEVGRPRLNLENLEGSSEFGFRLSVCRSRKPGLATITEEPIPVRSR